jgi:hypothetical protein
MLTDRGFALLTGRWRTLRHITASPSKIGDIARAALVLTHFEHGYITGDSSSAEPAGFRAGRVNAEALT